MNVTTASGQRPILLIEDNQLEYQAIARGLAKLNVPNPVVHFRDGDEALEYVRTYRPSAGELDQTPALVILDLNLPDTHGREILTVLKHHETLRIIPVIVWSISADPVDIKLCYLDGANSYIQKTVSVQGTEDLLKNITSYWLDLVTLPAPSSSGA